MTAKMPGSLSVCKLKEPKCLCPLTYDLVNVHSIYEFFFSGSMIKKEQSCQFLLDPTSKSSVHKPTIQLQSIMLYIG